MSFLILFYFLLFGQYNDPILISFYFYLYESKKHTHTHFNFYLFIYRNQNQRYNIGQSIMIKHPLKNK